MKIGTLKIAPKSALIESKENSLEPDHADKDQDPLVTFKHVSFNPNLSAINKIIKQRAQI